MNYAASRTTRDWHALRNRRGRFATDSMQTRCHSISKDVLYGDLLPRLFQRGSPKDWIPVSQRDGILKDIYEQIIEKKFRVSKANRTERIKHFLKELMTDGNSENQTSLNSTTRNAVMISPVIVRLHMGSLERPQKKKELAVVKRFCFPRPRTDAMRHLKHWLRRAFDDGHVEHSLTFEEAARKMDSSLRRYKHNRYLYEGYPTVPQNEPETESAVFGDAVLVAQVALPHVETGSENARHNNDAAFSNSTPAPHPFATAEESEIEMSATLRKAACNTNVFLLLRKVLAGEYQGKLSVSAVLDCTRRKPFQFCTTFQTNLLRFALRTDTMTLSYRREFEKFSEVCRILIAHRRARNLPLLSSEGFWDESWGERDN